MATNFIDIILIALAMVFVIEGLLYAAFPDMVRRLMAQALVMPAQQFRFFGLVMATAGFAVVWILSIL